MSNVFDIEIRINGIEYSNTLATDLEIDKGDLDTEFQQQSERYAYYGVLAEIAKDKGEHLKHELELLKARLDHETRNAALAAQATNPKFKMTEAMVENQVLADPRYQQKQDEYLDAKKLAGILHIAREAFQQRKDMLVSLGANHRFLNAMEPRVMMESGKERAKQTIAANRSQRALEGTNLDAEYDSTKQPDAVEQPQEAPPTRRRAPTTQQT